MKYIKKFFIIYNIFFLFLLIVELGTRYAELNFSILFLFYWMYLFEFILAIYIWKLNSKFTLTLGFVLTLWGMIFSVLGISGLAEVILRLGFIGWMVGIIQALLEYKNDVKK